MATDWYPSEEGAIFEDAAYILPCRPDGEILEMSSVKLGTSVSGRISVIASAAMGDGVGIALRASTAANAPERIPVLFYGAVKWTQDNGSTNTTSGQFVMNSITTTFTVTGAINSLNMENLVLFGGSSYIMGMALQTTTADADEILILVGKCI